MYINKITTLVSQLNSWGVTPPEWTIWVAFALLGSSSNSSLLGLVPRPTVFKQG